MEYEIYLPYCPTPRELLDAYDSSNNKLKMLEKAYKDAESNYYAYMKKIFLNEVRELTERLKNDNIIFLNDYPIIFKMSMDEKICLLRQIEHNIGVEIEVYKNLVHVIKENKENEND